MLSPDDPRHGTNAGYRAHHKWGVAICTPCRTAHAKQHQEFRNRRYLERLPTLLIDPAPTVRRIRALQAIGWPLGDIDAALGRPGKSSNIWKMLTQPSIHVDTAAKVEAIYDRLHMKPGPSSRTRGLAARRGWVPPLGWDDIARGVLAQAESDDGIDEVVIDRIVGGDFSVARAATKAERVVIVARWKAAGRPLAELERQAGWKPERYRSEEAA